MRFSTAATERNLSEKTDELTTLVLWGPKHPDSYLHSTVKEDRYWNFTYLAFPMHFQV